MVSEQKPQINLAAAKNRLSEASENMSFRETIRKSPMKAIGIALASGLVSGSSAIFQIKAAEAAISALVKECVRTGTNRGRSRY